MLVNEIMVPISPSGSFPKWVFPRVGVWPRWWSGVFGRHGATQDQPVGDLGRSGRESAVTMEEFRRNVVGPPEWECEAMGSVVWVQ